jgi:sugar phosphate isomerase/epimerase
MRRIGFSTGALALGDFERALAMMRGHGLEVVELSALREHELEPLVAAVPRLDLAQYQHIAVHAPSRVAPDHESEVVEKLRCLSARGWPVVVHPDAVHDWSKWKPMGSRLLIENMDRRKEVGRSTDDLHAIFKLVPEAGFCFDVGHARQCDTTMTEAYLILTQFGERLRQVHLSEVTSRSTHDRLSFSSIRATQGIAALIPEHIPIVLESPVSADELESEIGRANVALTVPVKTDQARTVAGPAGEFLMV